MSELRVDSVTNNSGTGPVEFPRGITIGGVTGSSGITTGNNVIIPGNSQTGQNLSVGVATGNFFALSNAGSNNYVGSDNIFIGEFSGFNNYSGYLNTFLNINSGLNNISGHNNNFIGAYSGSTNTYGSFNNFFGTGSGSNNITGNGNIYIGCFIGISTSSNDNIIIGNGEDLFPSNSILFDTPNINKNNQFAVGIAKSTGTDYWLVGNENFNIGIGTTNPTSKLTVGGDIKVGVNTSQGIILTSPNGTQYKIFVNNNGTLGTVSA
jgi:hypothetical protein